MSVKMSGAEFKKFYEDDEFWPDGAWHEDAQISVDGEDKPDGVESNEVSDTSVVVIEGGLSSVSNGRMKARLWKPISAAGARSRPRLS